MVTTRETGGAVVITEYSSGKMKGICVKASMQRDRLVRESRYTQGSSASNGNTRGEKTGMLWGNKERKGVKHMRLLTEQAVKDRREWMLNPRQSEHEQMKGWCLTQRMISTAEMFTGQSKSSPELFERENDNKQNAQSEALRTNEQAHTKGGHVLEKALEVVSLHLMRQLQNENQKRERCDTIWQQDEPGDATIHTEKVQK